MRGPRTTDRDPGHYLNRMADDQADVGMFAIPFELRAAVLIRLSWTS